MSQRVHGSSWRAAALALLVTGLVLVPVRAADKTPAKTTDKETKRSAAPIPMDAWAKASDKPLTSKELDDLINAALKVEGIKQTPLITDEQFIRRVALDLTGQLPTAKQVADFVRSTAANKRAKLVDDLLDSAEYSRYWARYWRQVIAVKLVNNFQSAPLARPFEVWMTTQLKENKSWAEITTAMLTAEGECKFDDDGKKGAHYFLAAHMGQEAAIEQASETARIFLGIQIQCAQCHDHPFDVWKREQFHTLTAYFVRVRSRQMRDADNNNRPIGVELVASRFGEHRMPDKDNPRAGKTMMPQFLNGNSPSGRDLGDSARRQSLVKEITSDKNPWYAAAYVNRIWGVLMGQSFYMPIDDMGPQKEAVMGEVLTRVAASFRGSKYDIKQFYRLVLNSEAYQRQIRPGEASTDHLQFAALYPTRLPADALWNSLVGVLGPLDRGGFGGGRPMPPGGGAGGFRGGFGGGLERAFKSEFSYDPSLKPDDVEGSVAMALLMMNNPQIQQRLEARGDNILPKILRDNSKDEDAINVLYTQVLARKPSARERDKCIKHIQQIGKRDEAFENILWALVNSTEFQTRR